MLRTRNQRRIHRTLALTLAVLLAEHAAPGTVFSWAAPPAPTAVPTEPSRDELAQADRHFRRGVDLYEDGDLAAALVEFSRAYEIVPSYKILYNLGQVAYRRQDYVRALDHFRRYLSDGRDGITPQRRRQVDDDIRRLEQRIGRIVVEAHPDDSGAEIRLDEVPVATAPLLDALVANVGSRKVELIRPSGERQALFIDVVGGETAHLRFPRTGVLRLSAVAPNPARSGAGPGGNVPTLVDFPGSPTQSRGERSRDWSAWAGWTVTGLLTAGAVATGVFAFTSSRDLQQRRDDYPVGPGQLDRLSSRAHALALTTDGLLVGAVATAAVSLYLTVRQSRAAEAPASTEGGSRVSSIRRDQQQRRLSQ